MSIPILSIDSPRVKSDRAASLITVACPKCGITVGILPSSTAWHGKCEARMVPVDPASAARLLKRARERRWYRSRAVRAPAERMEIQAQNPARMGLQQVPEGSDGS